MVSLSQYFDVSEHKSFETIFRFLFHTLHKFFISYTNIPEGFQNNLLIVSLFLNTILNQDLFSTPTRSLFSYLLISSVIALPDSGPISWSNLKQKKVYLIDRTS